MPPKLHDLPQQLAMHRFDGGVGRRFAAFVIDDISFDAANCNCNLLPHGLRF